MLVENFRPGVMDRLGLGYDAMQAANPRLVYCSIPGFSGDDARASMRGWEGIVSAATSIYRPPRRFGPAGPITDTDPSFTATPLLSTYAAAIAAHTVVAALLAHDESGRGQRVEVSLFDAAYEVFGHELQMAHNMSSGAFKPPPRPGLGHYKCKDGRWLHLCLFEDRHMRWFAQEFVPEWLAEGVAEPDRLRADPELQVELIKRFTELFRTGTRPSGSTTSTSAPGHRARSARRPTSGCEPTRVLATAMRSPTFSIPRSVRLPSWDSRSCSAARRCLRVPA